MKTLKLILQRLRNIEYTLANIQYSATLDTRASTLKSYLAQQGMRDQLPHWVSNPPPSETTIPSKKM